jgi:purine-cytosine permease-like protein
MSRSAATVKSVNFLGRRVPVPASMPFRVVMGVLLLCGGFLGFLPVLGFWMIPLGLLILSIDFAPVRRFRRKATVRLVGWLKRRFPALSARLGLR